MIQVLKSDVLGGLPGVWSARFAGVGATDQENNAKLLPELLWSLNSGPVQLHFTQPWSLLAQVRKAWWSKNRLARLH